MSQPSTLRRVLARLALLLTLPLVLLGLTSSPASAAPVVNVTFQVPATVAGNTCTAVPDVVALHGIVHIVITETANNSGGYQMTNTVDSHLVGSSLLTHVMYTNAENQLESWEAQPPFRAIHTHTYDFELVSRANTPNYVLHMTMHETVTANGTPSAVVDNWSMDCRG
jgi:hypothetical protein